MSRPHLAGVVIIQIGDVRTGAEHAHRVWRTLISLTP